jgi:hypothetical protein
VAGLTVECAPLAAVLSVGGGSASHWCGSDDRRGRCFCLCSVGRRGLSQPPLWRERQERALLWPLFAWWARAQPATVVVGTTGEGASLASVPSVGLGSASHCGGGHDSCWRCSGHCSLGRRRLSQPLVWRGRQLSALLWPLFARSLWA